LTDKGSAAGVRNLSTPPEFTRKANSGSPFLLPAAVTSGVSY
jgi:hypothetical protein